jgi:hypothetical protein
MYGLELTPKPLTHTAWEYYSMHYDRHADRRGPLGQRREKAEDDPETGDEAEGEEYETAQPAKKAGGLFGLGRKQEAAADADDALADDAASDGGYDDRPVAAGEAPKPAHVASAETSGDEDDVLDLDIDPASGAYKTST